ncbi:hypothetical protein HU200_038628 [Digitaria exilis]|uniref:Uncharacterized protein n=1 Tax=Digitaria exilis TaxID=1010633 RepID=A0A835BJ45_9POAL|nr:hypothetical protein HU200_038628 [Digitaria exilis]
MGSVLSAAYAALCSLVGALIDKAEMRELRAANPHLSAEEVENFWRWIRDQDAEQDARDAARRLRPHDPLWIYRHPRLNYRHPCYRIGADKNKLTENNVY